MKIGKLAQLAGTSSETIRYYEREGLLPRTGRTESNYRIYSSAHLERLTFIRHCRSLDMTLDEIRVLLHFKESPEENCDGVNRVLDEHIGHVASRIADLQKLEGQLLDLRQRCQESQQASNCGILQRLSQSSREKASSIETGHVTHVHGSR